MPTDVQAIKYLTGSEAEVLEFIAKPNSLATKAPIRSLGLPDDVIIGGIVRSDRVEIAVGATEIQAFDRVVVFALPSTVEKVCELFN
jgi:trk system potassium uptake protein TrkA